MMNEDSPELRASYEDRDRVAERLRIAAGDGRLTIEELDERLERALAARTGGELAALVQDLPATPDARGEPAAKELVRIEVGSSSTVREGRWILPRILEVKAVSGGVRLDLTDAVISQPTLQIRADVRSGSLTIITRPGIDVDVDVDDVTVHAGSVKVSTGSAPVPAPSSVLRVEVIGSVRSGTLVARPPRRGLLAWLLRRPPR